MAFQTFVKSQYAAKTIDEVLTSAPSVLLGVSAAAETALAALNIKTVFDLSLSGVFDNAARILAASQNPRSVLRRYGRASSSMVDAVTLDTETAELPYDDIDVLVGIGAAIGTALEQALSVTAIRDLALWPPFLAAKAIMIEAYNPPVGADDDAEAPTALVPRSGEFGTERHLYSSIVMFPGQYEPPGRPLNGVLFDMTSTPETGFDRLRYGARLTYAHSWSPVSVAKGHLLHSLPLAPGESTNVAVIDWTNKSSASTRQSLSESERLSSTNDRARTVSQIAASVANEFTSGSSVTVTQSTSVEGGVGGLTGFLFGSASGASNEQTAATHTVSTGDRNIATNLQQNIQDSTRQVSSSLRSERAASVSEINQAQSEQLSTRTVTNYNHMHALTVQYYEVVQIYETETRLENAERCIFLPMRPIDFTDERNIVKYLPILKTVALDGTTRSLLAEIEESAAAGYALDYLIAPGERLPASLWQPQVVVSGLFTITWVPGLSSQYAEELQANARELARDGFIGFTGDLDHLTLDYRLQLTNVRWSPARANAPRTPVVGVDFQLDDGTTTSVNQSAVDGADPSAVNVALSGGPLSFGRIRGISLRVDPSYVPLSYPPVTNAREHLVKLELAVTLANEARWLDLSFLLDIPVAGLTTGQCYQVSAPLALTRVGQILNDNRLYYSQQVWLREDPQTRIMQLAPLQLDVSGGHTINLVDYLSPQPLQVVGNYLVYRFTYEDDPEWQTWTTEHVDPSLVSVDDVAVPTGGVFAEAVLGRANSAEKLDLTRFFDWADSPPPVPPAIAPLKAGTHTPADAPAVGDFAKPMVAIQAPLTIPDPVALSALLTAVTTSDAFRNMSGLAASGDATNEALDASGKTATAALQAAGTTLATVLNAFADAMAKPDGKTAEKDMSATGAAANQKADAAKEAAKDTAKDGDQTAPSAGEKAKSDLVDQALANLGIQTGGGGTSDPGTTAPPPGTTDPALLNSALVTEPTFADVTGFVFLLQLVADADLIPLMLKRFGTLGKDVNPKQKFTELLSVITTHSASLENPDRFRYGAQYVKTGVLPSDADFNLAVVSGVRSSALSIAAGRALPAANTVNGTESAKTALSAILSACAAQGISDLDQVSYVLATAHHESAMGKYTTEIANGISSDTVFTRDAYFFNAIAGKKSSYNTLAGNTKAGTALRAAGTITTTADETLWNGTAYPDGQPAAVKIAARGCDFYVFIGRGYVQLTGRANYNQFSNLAAVGNIDLVASPERVAEPPIAAAIMALGMRTGKFRGNHKLADYDLAAGFDATNARDIINGDKATWGAIIRDIAKSYKTKLIQVPKLNESKNII